VSRYAAAAFGRHRDLVEGSDLEDDAYLSQLARVTADAAPPPKKRR
jgi:hypothetical protein